MNDDYDSNTDPIEPDADSLLEQFSPEVLEFMLGIVRARKGGIAKA